MTNYTPTTEAAEAACRAVHPTRWEYPATAHPCEECTTAVTAAAAIIEREVRERAGRYTDATRDLCAWGLHSWTGLASGGQECTICGARQ